MSHVVSYSHRCPFVGMHNMLEVHGYGFSKCICARHPPKCLCLVHGASLNT